MDSDQRLDELFASLTNFERTRTVSEEWSLDNMHALLRGAGARPEGGRWIQVGGSKGKGTTAAYLDALARASGLRTGVFTSPHLQHVAERVRIDGRPVAGPRLVEALEAVLAAGAAAGLRLSFFEAMTAAAVRLFGAAGLDVAIFEVGLGGRLDATTAVPVDATILTRIELEHTDLLGPDLASIASEKAHIMRAGRPAWVTPDPRTDRLFAAHAAAVGAELRPAFGIEDLAVTAEEFHGTLVTATTREPFVLRGASGFELPALALAHACLRELHPGLAIPLHPAPRPDLPGRFEVVPQPDGWPLILDGAHTPESMAQVATELRRRFSGHSITVLFGTALGKQWQAGLRPILPAVDRVFVTALTGTASEAPDDIAAWLREQGVPVEVVDGTEVGVQALLRSSTVRLVVGSFYLVGAVRHRLALP